MIFMTIKLKSVLFQMKPIQRAGDMHKDTLRLNWFSNSSFSFEHKARLAVKEKQRPYLDVGRAFYRMFF